MGALDTSKAPAAKAISEIASEKESRRAPWHQTFQLPSHTLQKGSEAQRMGKGQDPEELHL